MNNEMVKCKILIMRDTYDAYGDPISSGSVGPLTDWDEITQEDYDLLCSKLHTLPLSGCDDKLVLVRYDTETISNRISDIVEKMKEEEQARLRAIAERKEREEQNRIAKAARKLEQNKKALQKLLEENPHLWEELNNKGENQ